MTENTQASAPSTGGGMRSEIAQKWPKITAKEISDLKSKDDLVTEVQSKYQLDRVQAQKDVDAFAKNRPL